MDADRSSARFTDEIGDEELIEGVRANDEAACEALIRRHHQPLVRIARLYVSSDATAADVAQDTWMALAVSHPAQQGSSAETCDAALAASSTPYGI